MNLIELERWMENISSKIYNRRINNIILPGTHNSGAYKILYNKTIGNNPVQLITRYLSCLPCVADTIEDLTLCQESTIYQLLTDGVRFLDLRVSYNSQDNEYYISHTLICQKMDHALQNIVEFLEKNMDECLVVSLKNDFENRAYMSRNNNNEVCEMVEDRLGKYCWPSSNIFPYYGQMIEADRRVVFFYHGERENYNFIWNSYWFKEPWIDTDSATKKVQFLDKSLRDMTTTHINVLSFTLTPQPSTVVTDMFLKVGSLFTYEGESIRALAYEMQRYFDTFIRNNARDMDRMSVISTDFPTPEFIEKIVELNY